MTKIYKDKLVFAVLKNKILKQDNAQQSRTGEHIYVHSNTQRKMPWMSKYVHICTSIHIFLG